MKFRPASLSAFLLFVAPGQVLLAQQDQANDAASESSEPRDENLNAIRQTANDFAEAFNRGDAKAIAELWTTDGEYVDELVREFADQEAIEKGYALFFATNPNATLQAGDVGENGLDIGPILLRAAPPTPSESRSVVHSFSSLTDRRFFRGIHGMRLPRTGN